MCTARMFRRAVVTVNWNRRFVHVAIAGSTADGIVEAEGQEVVGICHGSAACERREVRWPPSCPRNVQVASVGTAVARNGGDAPTAGRGTCVGR